jgi:secreted trypsin-like serine protease
MKLIKIICFFLLLSNVVYSGTRHPLIDDSKYTDFGKKFPFVGRLCGKYRNGKVFCASSVAIKNKIILTAAHVVNEADSCVLHINDKKILIKRVVCHKEFEENNFGFYDIAVCSLEEDSSLDFYPNLYTDTDEIGKLATISGFGINGTFETGAINSDTKQRAGSNRIDRVEKGLLICSPTSLRSDREFSGLEFLISSGDSGGGLFIGNRIAGINSCVMSIDKNPDSSYGDESGHTRISDHIDWINKNVEALEKE